jgi:hypothetical protein
MKKVLPFILLFVSTLAFSQVKQMQKMRFVENENGKKIEVEVMNGEVSAIKENDKVVPKEKFGDYKTTTDRLLKEMNANAPLMEKSEKGAEKIEKSSALQTISTKKDGENMILTINNSDFEPLNLTITKDGKIVFDGNNLKDGSKIVFESNKIKKILEGKNSEEKMELIEEKQLEKMLDQKSGGEERRITKKIVVGSDDPNMKRVEIEASEDDQWLDDALFADKLIEKKGNFDFNLNDKTLIINGKEQSKASFQKYKKLFEARGVKFSEKTKIELSKKVN